MPPNSLMKSLRYAVTTSFGSICYGSLFTAAIRTLRWKVHMPAFSFLRDGSLIFLFSLRVSNLILRVLKYISDQGTPIQDWQQ